MRRFLFLLLLLAVPVHAADVKIGSPTAVSVAVTSTAVTTRATRAILILQNASDTAIWCNLSGGAAVVGEGIGLDQQPAASRPGGAAFFDIAVPTGTINCIHGGSGTKTILINEG